MYELSENTIERLEDTLTQVRFTDNIPKYGISKGALGGWVKSLSQIKGDPVLISGEFHAGEFHAGVFHGGVFHGGVFHAGEFHAGVFHGGVFHGGVFRGGYFHSGEFHAGVFHAGVFRGGEFHGGEYTKTPIQIFHYGYAVTLNEDGYICIGCQRHTMEDWREKGKTIAKREGVNDVSPYEKILDFIEAMEEGTSSNE